MRRFDLKRLPSVIAIVLGSIPFWLRLLDLVDKGATVMDTLRWLDHPVIALVLIIGGLGWWAFLDRPAAEPSKIMRVGYDAPARGQLSQVTALVAVLVGGIVIALGMWWFTRKEPVELLNVRIEMPRSVGWPIRPDAFPPDKTQFFEFMTSAINLSDRKMILDFNMVFKFDGKPVKLHGTPLPNNTYLVTPAVYNRDEGKQINDIGLHVAPLQQVQLGVVAQLPTDATMDVHHEALLVVEDRVSSKRTTLPVMRWTNKVAERNLQRHGMTFPPLQPSK